MNHFLLTFLLMGPPTGEAASGLEQAKVLFQQGTARYDSADYEGAIENFTSALGIVVAQEGNDRIRLTLLYNIALAHEKLFKIDKDVSHLRQALELYTRYRDFASTRGDLVEELDVETRILHLEKQLKIHDQLMKNRTESSENAPMDELPPPPSEKEMPWRRPRNLGIGLVVGGGVFAVSGITLAVVGSRLETRATSQVNELADLGVPLDHPAWQEGDAFITQQKRRGNILMGVGASLAISGVAGAGAGAYYLVKSKKMKESAMTVFPAMSPGYAGVRISGKF